MILLTGCGTLLGQKLMEALQKKGETLRCFDFYKPSGFPEGIDFFKGDPLNTQQLKKALKGVHTVFHFMDIKRPGIKGRRYMKKVNVTGTANLLTAARNAGVKRFFFLSSHSVYGKKKALPLRQDDWKRPVTAYGRDKLKGETLCWKYIEKNYMAVTIFRPAPVLAPYIEDPAVLTILFMALGMKEENRLYISNNGNTRYQLLHIDDAIRAFMTAFSSRKASGKAYNIGSDNVPTQIEEIVKVRDRLKIDPPVTYIQPWKARLYHLLFRPTKSSLFTREHLIYLIHGMIMDCQRIKDDLGWKPEKDNIEILTETAQWYMKEKL